MGSTTKLQHLNGTPAFFLFQGVAKNHDVIGNEFLHAITSYFSILLSSLCRHQCRYVHSAQSGSGPKELATDYGVVWQLTEYGAKRVNCNSTGLDLANGVFDARQQCSQIVLTAYYGIYIGLT